MRTLPPAAGGVNLPPLVYSAAMRWLLLFVLICAGVYAWWSWGESHPEIAACSRFADLCGPDSRKQCDDSLDALLRTSGREALRPSLKCLRDATSCPQAAGCMAGAAGRAGVRAAEDFFKGLGESLGK